ncbi:hypothetical protein NEOLEDRAFT_1245481 [Neolentinus lepideus HHB14362 ss-1]|uniref:Uncharacterized protein n=1 Tax=Neolentinus lepideus HHB14362 ss-1 TaxID=1314782 RepID=A0A165NQD9_9AGAM|nr:hypothetical protein NEOLEDRAFT_1245481 [Neolentinus lepideus HHB14362 ss-1]
MSIQVPVNDSGFALPAEPQQHPTLEDVGRAHMYGDTLQVAHALQDDSALTLQKVGEAKVYAHIITSAHAGEDAAPP